MSLRVQDVAAYLLEKHQEGPKHGALEAMKIHRLCYYAQAWHLVWDDAPLFSEEIQAWGSGPVCPTLYELHRGLYRLSSIPGGNAAALQPVLSAQTTIEVVLKSYGGITSPMLADLARSEDPWLRARRGLPDGVRGAVVIPHSEMKDFYGSLGTDNADPV